MEASYLAYTNYHDYPGGRKKLRVVVQVCRDLSESLGRPPRILDIGCGNGSITFPLASLGYPITGIDVSNASISHAAGKCPFRNARFLAHDLSQSPLPERYDLIICSEVLEHLSDPSPLVKGMTGALEPGGIAVVTVPNGYGLREVMGRLEHGMRGSRLLTPAADLFRRLLGMKSAREKCLMHTSNPEQDHVQKFTPRQFTLLLSSHGLAVEGWVNSFWLLSLFGKANKGVGWLARLDSWLADRLPAVYSSGWYVICRRR